MNLSETAFLIRQDDGYDLRWFTPAMEVDLCGHATLASAHVLWEEGHLPKQMTARFSTRSGLLTAERKGEWIELNFPAKLEEPAAVPPDLAKALGVAARYGGKNQFDYLVEVASETEVRNLKPDFSLRRQRHSSPSPWTFLLPISPTTQRHRRMVSARWGSRSPAV